MILAKYSDSQKCSESLATLLTNNTASLAAAAAAAAAVKGEMYVFSEIFYVILLISDVFCIACYSI